MDRTVNGRCLCLLLAFVCMMISMQANADSYYERKVSLFDLLPIENGDVVFLGNSITDGGEFQELFGNLRVKNRGINSDVINGVENRLYQIIQGRPAKIFLLIGINDISHNLSVDEIASAYKRLVQKIRSESPETDLYLQSIMPVDNSFGRYKSLYGKEKTIEDVNLRIKDIASECGARYINLWDVLAVNGRLKREYTNDGLHLTGKGYAAWIDFIRPYVESNNYDENE